MYKFVINKLLIIRDFRIIKKEFLLNRFNNNIHYSYISKFK